jgi:hypothetical protein
MVHSTSYICTPTTILTSIPIAKPIAVAAKNPVWAPFPFSRLNSVATDLTRDDKGVSVVVYEMLCDVRDSDVVCVFVMHDVGLPWQDACEL